MTNINSTGAVRACRTAGRTPNSLSAALLRFSLVRVALLLTIANSSAAQQITFDNLPTNVNLREFGALLPSDDSIPTTGTWIGATTSQADVVMNADAARANFGVNGSGIKIGVISDSFNALGGQAGGVATGDLPGVGNPNGFLTPVSILNDDFAPNRIDEGRAMAELIHDLAPGAEILFHSAFNNLPETSPGDSIATAINNLAAAGADIIVDDVFNLTIPAYQDGASAQAVNAAFAQGIPYFSAAGNNADNAYEAQYSATGGAGIGVSFHDFDANTNEGGSQALQLADVPDGGLVRATLWWEDPYASVGGAPTSDFDLFLFDLTNGGNLVAASVSDQLVGGADAFEFVAFENNTGADVTYALAVDLFGGDDDKLIKLSVFGPEINDDDDTDSPTIFGHAAAEGGLAIAAAPYFAANIAEPFTSEGPTLILFDENGNPDPELRATPQLTGIDGTNTTFFGADIPDPDPFPNFFGTSAAAPHVAAVAALMLDRADDLGVNLSPDELYNLLFNSTIDIEDPGFDFFTGFGRLDAQLAVGQVVPEPSGAVILVLAMVFGLGWRQRR